MKCKICGYEFDDSRNNCPMCGTPVASADGTAVEMKWNTKDFPKPQKEVADIQMQWATPDVSEGYISVPDRPKRQFSTNNEVSRPYIQPENVPAAQPIYTDPDAQRVPRVEEGRLPEKFYTFQTKNEEFQKLLDKEFERLRELQSQLPESKSFPLPGMQPAVSAAPADDFDKMLLEDTSDSEVLPAAESFKDVKPAAPKVHADEPFDIKTLEDSIRLIREEEEIAQRESEERLRKLEAMKAARDAYFKSLDEAEAKKPMKGFFWRDRDTVKPEPEKTPEKAPEKETFAPEKTAEAPAPGPVIEIPVLEDLTGARSEDPERTIQFVKEDFVAAQDAMLRETAQMQTAPEVPEEPSFIAEEPVPADEAPAFITEALVPAEEEPVFITEAPVPAEEEPAFIEEEPIPAEEIPAAAETVPEPEDIPAEPQTAEPAEEPAVLLEEPEIVPEDVSVLLSEKQYDPIATQTFHGLLDEADSAANNEAQEDAEDEYDDEEDDEDIGRHGFLKFLGLFLLILILIQLIVLGFEKFLPDAAFTQTLMQITSSIQQACDAFLANVIDKISELFN